MQATAEQITVENDRRPGLLGRLRSEFSFMEGNFLVMVVSWLVLDFFVELPGTYYALYVEALWAVAISLLVYGDFYRLLVAMVLVGLIMVMANSAIGALTADLVPSEHRGKVNGSRGFFSLLAASAGNLLGGWMYDNVSHQLPFLIQIGLVAIPFLMVWF